MRIRYPILAWLTLATLIGPAMTGVSLADDVNVRQLGGRRPTSPRRDFGIIPQVRQLLQKRVARRPGGKSVSQHQEEIGNPIQEAAYQHDPTWTNEPTPSSDLEASGCEMAAVDNCAAQADTRSWFGRSQVPVYWADVNYLVWGTKAMYAPALATTSPDGTAAGMAGVLGEDDTSILFGDSSLNEEAQSGARFTLGAWLNPCQRNGLEVTYLFVAEQTDGFTASQDEFSILARPFFNVETDAEDSRLIVFPGLVEGSLAISAESAFQTLALVSRNALVRSPYGVIDYVAGYRFGRLHDNITIRESTLSLAGATSGTRFDLFDAFDTENSFHGGEIGIEMKQQINCVWSCDMSARVAIGGTWLNAQVAGQTDVTLNDVTTSNPGGLLTQSTNLGDHDDSEFSTISEFGVTLRRRLGNRTEITIGYNYIFWSNVLRAGDQIDLSVNPTQIPPGMLVGAARPAFPFNTADFWAHGLRLGLVTRF